MTPTPINEIFAVHYKGKLIDRSNSSDYGYTRKGKIYTTIGPAKAFMTRLKNYLTSVNREEEIKDYSIVRYVPEEQKTPVSIMTRVYGDL